MGGRMRQLIRIIAPVAVFTIGVVMAPGFAGAQLPVDPTGSHASCAPVPQCIDPDAVNAQVGDNLESKGGLSYGYCNLQTGAVLADNVASGQGTGVGSSGCSYGDSSGTTYYKPRGTAENGTPATGNFNHKFDNEEHMISCGGGDVCTGETWLTNSSQSRSFYHDYKDGPGWAGYNFPRTAGRPFCNITVNGNPPHALKNECYYVYG